MSVEIVNQTKFRIKKELVNRIANKTILLSGMKTKKIDVSLVFVNKAKIKEINRIYRKKSKVTDILSFNYKLGYNKKKDADIEGELVLCPEIIAGDAKKNKVSFDREFAFVLSHGILHLLGMRHSKKMYGIQDTIVKNIKK